MSDSDRTGPSTRAVHAGEGARDLNAPVVNPIVLSTTFYNAPDGEGPVLYQRYGNAPNHVLAEERVAALEGAEDAVILASGMAAMACAVLSVVQAGDHIVATEAIYGGTRALLETELPRLGITATFVDMFQPGWTDAFRPNTKLVMGESPSNPLLRVMDLAALAHESHARGATVIVDSTFASPLNCRPLEHGVDLVMHSATKYLGGHSDVTAGVIAGSRARVKAVRDRAKVWGPALDPHAVWLLERGMKTLALRMERHNANGLAVAAWAETHPGIARVHYPGLVSHPDHETARRVLHGFGGMIGLEIAGGGPAAAKFVRALKLAKLAPSLGGVETLMSEPRYTSHAAMTPAQREANGIRDGFIRVSLGIEDAADIIADLEQALAVVAAGAGAEERTGVAAD
ncbi:PLP-dependent aspartate aminotransferase family protein [Longimicrobium sp.]|uniref:trans-sulfuration enzyme family protein n=1 Tax=Longimicrobium sp. TaxID=2029185 RepID=UPI002C671941|nr:PLP-dependent aspartate aminotransferase family protein [Longimicrobium sp.]HSU15889.1 PLP-dependent aspartate aminotransferase family protein [Longimicrobium sp.]